MFPCYLQVSLSSGSTPSNIFKLGGAGKGELGPDCCVCDRLHYIKVCQSQCAISVSVCLFT